MNMSPKIDITKIYFGKLDNRKLILSATIGTFLVSIAFYCLFSIGHSLKFGIEKSYLPLIAFQTIIAVPVIIILLWITIWTYFLNIRALYFGGYSVRIFQGNISVYTNCKSQIKIDRNLEISIEQNSSVEVVKFSNSGLNSISVDTKYLSGSVFDFVSDIRMHLRMLQP